MFKKTEITDKRINKFNAKLDGIIGNLQPFEKKGDNITETLTKIKNDFKAQINDFYGKERKLRIGVIGQVKAGKSSFLNALLFEGKDVLPKAATPKTANLTVITHEEKNSLEVFFYNNDEWNALKELATKEGERDEVKVAKEIMQMAKERNLNVEEYIAQKSVKNEYGSYEEMLGVLNEYAAENGKYTPIVKYLQLTVNNENLKNLEIVDTPGMNDPIVSRTDKTREYIKKCDVVFFLSRSSQFLDSSDMELLSRQLPQQGVAKMVLTISQFDSAINDEIFNVDSLEEAVETVKISLTKRAKTEFEKLIAKRKEMNAPESIIKTLEQCKTPVLISSMAYNMSKKEVKDFTEEERNVYAGLSEFSELTKEELAEIGNFDELKRIFDEVVEQKDNTIFEKSQNLVPTVITRTKDELNVLNEKISKRVHLLEKDDISKLKKEKAETSRQINGVKASLESVFGELSLNFDKAYKIMISDIRRKISEYRDVNERTGTEEKTGSREVSASKWWNPFSWGSTRTEYYTYTATYSYLDISDVVENIRLFSNDSINTIEEKINGVIDVIGTKKKLLRSIIENFDASAEDFDPNFYKLIVEKTLNKFELPEIKIDVSAEMEQMASAFGGEIREGDEKAKVKLQLANTLSKIFQLIEKELKVEIKKVKDVLENAKDGLAETLLKEINDELNTIMSQFNDRENELKRMKNLAQEIKKSINEIDIL